MRRLEWWLGLITALLAADLVLSTVVFLKLARRPAGERTVEALTEQALPKVMPQVLHRVKPEYPPQAREKGWEGRVILNVTVDTMGMVRRVEVVRSSGYAVLDSAAIAAVKQWRFSPAREDGRPVEATLLIPFQFSLSK